MTISKQTCTQLRIDLAKAFESIEKKHGIKMQIGNIIYNDHSIRTKLEAFLADSNNTGISIKELAYKSNLKPYGWKFGVHEAMYGKSVNLARLGTCTFIGCKKGYSKHPLVYKTADGRLVLVPELYKPR